MSGMWEVEGFPCQMEYLRYQEEKGKEGQRRRTLCMENTEKTAPKYFEFLLPIFFSFVCFYFGLFFGFCLFGFGVFCLFLLLFFELKSAFGKGLGARSCWDLASVLQAVVPLNSWSFHIDLGDKNDHI